MKPTLHRNLWVQKTISKKLSVLLSARCQTRRAPQRIPTPELPKKAERTWTPEEAVDEVQAKKTKTMEELRMKFDSKTHC